VLVQHHDIQDTAFGSGYTVKEYHSKKVQTEDGWKHTQIALRPKSDNTSFEEIILKKNTTEDLKVVGVFQAVLR